MSEWRFILMSHDSKHGNQSPCVHVHSYSCIFHVLAGKGFWAEKLGVGDFYYELGVQIIEVGNINW